MTILEDTLEAIERERAGDGFDGSFNLVDQLVNERGEHDLANRLFREIPLSIPWEIVADLFAILVWSTNDNGTELCRTAEHWLLQANDLRKIQIALHLDSYPFLTFAEMEKALTNVARRFPQCGARCEQLISERRKNIR